MNASKIPLYIKHRLSGLVPIAAAQAAGYSAAGMSVAVARLESREDVRQALRQGAASKVPSLLVSGIVGRDSELHAYGLKRFYERPLDLLLDVMNNPRAPTSLRIQCAKEALPYCHSRKIGP